MTIDAQRYQVRAFRRASDKTSVVEWRAVNALKPGDPVAKKNNWKQLVQVQDQHSGSGAASDDICKKLLEWQLEQLTIDKEAAIKKRGDLGYAPPTKSPAKAKAKGKAQAVMKVQTTSKET